MSDGGLLARVRDRPGGLERVISLLRRRAFRLRRLSVSASQDGMLEVIIRLDPSRQSSRARVLSELVRLVDVLEVRELADGAPNATRELVLARVASGGPPVPEELGRTVGQAADGTVIEITGAPAEVEAALARLREQAPISGLVRSGEVAIPEARETAHENGTRGSATI